MEGKNSNYGIAIKNCKECREENRLFEIKKILEWRAESNYLSALAFDKNTGEILVNKDSLMRAIQLANPGQAYRNIRLVEYEEYKALKDKTSDYTSWDEKVRKEKMAHKGPLPAI